MVTYKNIIKAIENDIIQKHSQYLINIEKALRNITDNDEEYKILKEDIWKFYKETKGIDHEEMIIKCFDGAFFENRDGDEHSVPLTDEMKQYANENECLYLIHNHPKSSCFQSNGDLSTFTNYAFKYNISVGKDGIMVFKMLNFPVNNHSTDYFRFTIDLNSRYNRYFEHMTNDFKKEYGKEINRLKQKHNINLFSTSKDVESFKKEYFELWNKYTDKNISNMVSGLNEVISMPHEDYNVGAYYIPRKIKK